MSQQAGWYDDPQDEASLRYWDGVQWTNHTSPKQKPGLDRAGQARQDLGAAEQTGGGQQGWGQQAYGQNPNPYAQQGQAPYQGQWQGRPMQGYGHDQRPTTPDGQLLAGWGMRLLARVLDWIVLVLVAAALLPLLAPDALDQWQAWWEELMRVAQSGGTVMPEPPTALLASLAPWTVGQAVFAFVYELVMVKLFGGTLGKLATGLRVRLREAPGMTWGAAGIRAAVWDAVPGMLDALPGLGFLGTVFRLANGLWPLWDPQRQALHDKAARTNVVRKR